MTPTPDAKGTQPEQLVLEAREWARILRSPDFDAGEFPYEVAARSFDTLATALSECRERRDEYQVRARAAAHVISRRGLIPEYDYEYELLAAQPPSEASERSGT